MLFEYYRIVRFPYLTRHGSLRRKIDVSRKLLRYGTRSADILVPQYAVLYSAEYTYDIEALMREERFIFYGYECVYEIFRHLTVFDVCTVLRRSD